MAEIAIDGVRALELLREVVTEHGANTSYQPPESLRCVYEHGGAPSCLVGHALHRAGLPIERLRELDSELDQQIDAVDLPDWLDLEDAAVAVLGRAQRVQDGGGSWGDALAAAEAEARSHGGAA